MEVLTKPPLFPLFQRGKRGAVQNLQKSGSLNKKALSRNAGKGSFFQFTGNGYQDNQIPVNIF
jgi:hypothetical protein